MSAVTCTVRANLRDMDRRSGPIRLELRWCPADPYSVRLTSADVGIVGDEPGEDWGWEFDVDLLRDGMRGRAGIGDVVVQRVWSRVVIALSSPDGQAELSVPLGEVRGFLRQVTPLLAPAQRAVDWDDVVARLSDVDGAR